jgi:aspartate dehydrogenase
VDESVGDKTEARSVLRSRPEPPQRVVVLGFGAIGSEVAQGLAGDLTSELLGVLVRRLEVIPPVVSAVAPGVWVGVDASVALGLGVTLIVECAGHAAVADHLEGFLEAGADALITSTGALVDADTRGRLIAAARSGGGKIRLSAGAIAGIDGLSALALAGLDEVLYTSSKPPAAWKGTAADSLLDLDACHERTVFFEGSAADAARDFPKNANIAATVAFAGLGLERTGVRLAADPALCENVGHLLAYGSLGTLDVRFHSPPSSNPRTSAITAFSVLREIRDGTSAAIL